MTVFLNDPERAFQAIHMPEFGLSWAGANPFGEGFCFGAEKGRLVFTDTRGRPRSLLDRASASGEAINGVAYSRGWLAVTTRKDINLIPPLSVDRPPPDAIVIFGGATDVVAAPSGHFVIPLGKSGLMFAKPGMKENDPVTISNGEKQGMNYCRVIALKGDEAGDLIVAAGRRGGIAFSRFQEGIRGHLLTMVKFSGLDIVDVCLIGDEKNRSVAAVARDGSVVFFRDILTDRNPETIKFRSIEGAVYRILAAGEDLYLLTSKGLFAIFKLAERFSTGQPVCNLPTDILRLSMEAADANLVEGRWLLAVGVDNLYRIDVARMPKEPPASIGTENGHLAREEQEVPQEVDAAPEWAESAFEEGAAAV
jgi:hypothetical protein